MKNLIYEIKKFTPIESIFYFFFLILLWLCNVLVSIPVAQYG